MQYRIPLPTFWMYITALLVHKSGGMAGLPLANVMLWPCEGYGSEPKTGWFQPSIVKLAQARERERERVGDCAFIHGIRISYIKVAQFLVRGECFAHGMWDRYWLGRMARHCCLPARGNGWSLHAGLLNLVWYSCIQILVKLADFLYIPHCGRHGWC